MRAKPNWARGAAPSSSVLLGGVCTLLVAAIAMRAFLALLRVDRLHKEIA